MWYIIIAFIAAIYLLLNYVFSTGFVEVYIIRPIMWIMLALITFLIAREEGQNIIIFKKIRKWTLGKTPIHAGLMLGGFYIAILIIVGILFGFGKSPYSFTLTGISVNIFFIISFLLGSELSRSYLLKKFTNSRKYTTISLVVITILFLIISIKSEKFSLLLFNNPVESLEFIGSILIVTLAIQLLATYLCYLGGATASISFLGTIMVFEYFSPILPNPHWTILGLVGTITPALGFIILQESINPFIERKKTKRRKSQSSGHGWTIVAIFTVILVFFSYGFLGVTPKVIYSGSMQPTYEIGDLVITDEIDSSQIKTGDVIMFVRNNITVMHRVEEIFQDENGVNMFIVKGDANDDPDPIPVQSYQILGKAIYNIPKIGWIQIFIRDLFRAILSPIKNIG